MKKSLHIFIVIFFLSFNGIIIAAAQTFNIGDFSKPMQLPFNLAGTFGEPRPDHFHSGIDIKTNGVEGAPVIAIAAGFISRIRVSPYGYGKAIYVTHRNGYTSVYGHLSKFYGKIEQYIHTKHYAVQKSELDITLDSTTFVLQQNDTIAFSGNTGGSTAPHLHFEIRNTQTEHALNPLDFYPKNFYVDTIAPQINSVKLYFFDTSSFYNSVAMEYPLVKQNGIYTTTTQIQKLNYPMFAISLEGFDKQDDSENKNGIQKMNIFEKDSLVFQYNIKDIDFNKTRMCNAFVDYDEMKKGNGYFYNGYQLKNNSLPFYLAGYNGFFDVHSSNFSELKIQCFDYNNNKSEIQLNFKNSDNSLSKSSVVPNAKAISKFVKTDNTDSLLLKNIKIKFSPNTFYDNASLAISTTKKEDDILSDKYTLGNLNGLIPLQKPVIITLVTSIKKLKNKIVFVCKDFKGKETALKTTFNKSIFYTSTTALGTYYLKYDTVKPIVEKIEILPETISVHVVDNLSGVDIYNGYIDNNWVNFYYDAKNDNLIYNIDERCTKGEHLLKLIVTDKVGNENILLHKFILP